MATLAWPSISDRLNREAIRSDQRRPRLPVARCARERQRSPALVRWGPGVLTVVKRVAGRSDAMAWRLELATHGDLTRAAVLAVPL